MIGKMSVWGSMATMIASLVTYGGISSGAADSGAQIGIPPETVADYLHAVIEADRTFYTIHVVERMQANGIVVASENWLPAKTLPLPAQFLMESAQLASITGTKIAYRLISMWPINKRNGALTEFERAGLEEVQVHPDRRHVGIITQEGTRYFQAIYADRAVSQACIGCHNAHPSSPKRDFKMHDVMGAIVITIPVGQ
jgi:hypothetical protein